MPKTIMPGRFPEFAMNLEIWGSEGALLILGQFCSKNGPVFWFGWLGVYAAAFYILFCSARIRNIDLAKNRS